MYTQPVLGSSCAAAPRQKTDSRVMEFGIGPFSNSSFHELTDMILEYTHTTGNENEEMWHVLTDYNIPVEERYNKMGFDFPDVPR